MIGLETVEVLTPCLEANHGVPGHRSLHHPGDVQYAYIYLFTCSALNISNNEIGYLLGVGQLLEANVIAALRSAHSIVGLMFGTSPFSVTMVL